MTFKLKPFLGIFLLSVCSSTPAWANNNNNATVTSAVVMQAPKKESRIWSGFFNMSRSMNAIDQEDGNRLDGMDYMARLNLRINKDYAIRAQGGYSQDLKDSQNNDFSDTSVSFVRSAMPVGKTFLMNYRINSGLPTSKDSRIRQNLMGSLSGAVSFIVNPKRLQPGVDISASLSVGRNFHQYETALDGRVNTEWSSSQALSLGYNFSFGLSLTADFSHRNTWSYQNVMRDSFALSQEIGYQMNSSIAIAAGHSNSGSTLKPNGQDTNVQFFDDNSSIVYGSLTYIF